MVSPTIRVLCVDDHPIVREGIELVIQRQADMLVVGSAGTAEEAILLSRSEHPDVVLMDLRLGATRAIEAIQEIRREDNRVRIVVLSVSQSEEDVHEALAAGAVTYLFKDALSTDLVRVIREVAAGVTPERPEIRVLLQGRASHAKVTRREREVIQIMARGLSNREIAAILGISELTVQVHVKNIFSKLNATDRTTAVYIALRRGIVQLD
jgi:two-component system NarL family response regulator